MKIYYLKDANCAYSADEQNLLSTLEGNHTLAPIHIKKCTKTRYLCKKERVEKLKRDLSKLKKYSVIAVFSLMHLGKSHEEISLLLAEMPNYFFVHVQPSTSVNNFFKDAWMLESDEYKSQRITHDSFMGIPEEYIKKESILYGLRCSKTKLTGRKKGATNKESDYDPYRDKIIEGLKNNMSIRGICAYINFGTKSGLEYYIKQHKLKP